MGAGVVGDGVRHYFERTDHEIRVYDPGLGLGSVESINEADIVFVCVPTPYLPQKGFDDSALENAISVLEGSKTIVIKSTVLPGTTEAYQSRFSQHCLLFNPEFLREAHARTDFLCPDRQIVGYTEQSRHVADAVLALLPAAPYTAVIGAREAEMTKYMTNTFLALKVEYEQVKEAFAADARIGATHLDVNDGGYRGYGGKCLPKDTRALLELGERMQVPLRLLRTADRINDSFLPPSDEPAPLKALSTSSSGDADTEVATSDSQAA
jgi:UDPglucose 6-dehydrogenase